MNFMKTFFATFFFTLIFAFTAANALSFKCLARNGWSPVGYGRYSHRGEWIDYFEVYAGAGEFVLFYYPKGRHGYWFPKHKCIEVKR